LKLEEKAKLLQEWWTKDLEMISKLKLSIDCFQSIVESSTLHFRHGM